MYYRNDYNSPHEPWEQPIETTGHVVEEPGHKEPKKKKSFGGKIVALCLVCALVGGVAGGAGVAAFSGNGSGGGSTTLVEGERTQIYQTYVGSTVGITTEIVTTNYFGQPVSQAAAGSGFVISDNGYILTNYHVIKGASSIKVAFMDGTNYDATLVGGESENDIAVLKINASGLSPVVLGNSDNVQVGEQVVAIGNPMGEELRGTMTDGILSAINRAKRK